MIQVNVITGLLGTGKTTAIRHWLSQAPEGERWAVLVNEFGEIGIDGRLLSDTGVQIKEVPGGCLCCTAGVAFQVGLNELIRTAKPERILIEPTGLGHPKQVLQQLQEAQYQNVLTLGATICLLNPAHCVSDKHLALQTFHDQIAASDQLVINRQDVAEPSHTEAAKALAGKVGKPYQLASHGEIDWSILVGDHQTPTIASHHHHHAPVSAVAVTAELDEDRRWQRFSKTGQGMLALGWIIDAAIELDVQQVQTWMEGLPIERAKAIFNTPVGWLQLQWADGCMTTMPGVTAPDSRIELLALAEDAPTLNQQADLFEANFLPGE